MTSTADDGIDATDWPALTARAGVAAHDLVGWMMWDPGAIARYEALGVPGGTGWIVAWRLAALGDPTPAVATAVAYSISQPVIEAVLELQRSVTDTAALLDVRDASVEPGMEDMDRSLI